jgi:hypothetical protein
MWRSLTCPKFFLPRLQIARWVVACYFGVCSIRSLVFSHKIRSPCEDCRSPHLAMCIGKRSLGFLLADSFPEAEMTRHRAAAAFCLPLRCGVGRVPPWARDTRVHIRDRWMWTRPTPLLKSKGAHSPGCMAKRKRNYTHKTQLNTRIRHATCALRLEIGSIWPQCAHIQTYMSITPLGTT